MRKRLKGFTLVELMIVIGIIAFLVLFGASYLRSQIFKSTDARRKAEIKRIAIAVEEYEKDNDCYPLPSSLTCKPGTGLQPYLSKTPCDPQTDASYYYEHEDSVCPKWFKVYAVLQNESDPDFNGNIGPNSAYSFVYESPNAPITVPVQGGQAGPPDTDFYGCLSGVCTLITWDPTRPGPSCDPNYQNSTCYGQCANPQNQCEPWK